MLSGTGERAKQDEAAHTVRGEIRVPAVIVAVNYARMPEKRPKLGAKAIRTPGTQSWAFFGTPAATAWARIVRLKAKNCEQA